MNYIHFTCIIEYLKHSLQMQVAILTRGIVAGRMGLLVLARALHGQGNLDQLQHLTRDQYGIILQGQVRGTLLCSTVKVIP